MNFAREMAFSGMHLFRYSPRQGTVAAKMSGQVAGDIKRHRMRRAQELAAELKSHRLSAEVGRTADVHWEAEGRGYTSSYFRVRSGGDTTPVRNSFERVRVLAEDSGLLVVARE